MAIITLNPMIRSIHGKMGDTVFVHRKGTQFIRPYIVPNDPKTKSQMRNRLIFACLIGMWQKLPQNYKDSWNRYGKTKGRRGYNIFISENIKRIGQGKSPKLWKEKNLNSHEYTLLRGLQSHCVLFDVGPLATDFSYFPYKRNVRYIHRE